MNNGLVDLNRRKPETHSASSLPRDAWKVVLQPPTFSKGQYFKWEKELGVTAQDWSGLAEGGRIIFLWLL